MTSCGGYDDVHLPWSSLRAASWEKGSKELSESPVVDKDVLRRVLESVLAMVGVGLNTF